MGWRVPAGRVRHLHYGEPNPTFAVFDAYFGAPGRGRYLAAGEIEVRLGDLFPLVPVLYEGPFSEAVLLEHTGGATVLGGGHVREGVVVKPAEEDDRPKEANVLGLFGDEGGTGTEHVARSQALCAQMGKPRSRPGKCPGIVVRPVYHCHVQCPRVGGTRRAKRPAPTYALGIEDFNGSHVVVSGLVMNDILRPAQFQSVRAGRTGAVTRFFSGKSSIPT